MSSTVLILTALVVVAVAIPTAPSPDGIITEAEVADTVGDLPSAAGAPLAGQAIAETEPDAAVMGDSPLPSSFGGDDSAHYEIDFATRHGLTDPGAPFDTSSNNKGPKPSEGKLKTSHVKAEVHAAQAVGAPAAKLAQGPLICNIGTYHVNNGKLTHKVKNGCDTTSLEIKDNSKNHSVVCSRSSHSCMSGAYAGDPPTIIAFGCVPTSKVKDAQKALEKKCAADKECDYANDDGSPQGGYQICNSDKCNPCNSASGLAPTFLVGLLCVVASMLNTA